MDRASTDTGIPTPAWPYGHALRRLRGTLSAERAARRVDVTRQTWAAWESGRQVPNDESLRAIVEAFDCPPDLIGYTAPAGWELVPAEWITAETTALREEMRRLHEETRTMLGDVLNAIRASDG